MPKRKHIKENKSPLSKATSYQEIGEFWDEHDLADYWDSTRQVEFDVNITSEIKYYPLEKSLSDHIQRLSRERGVSAGTLINLWVQEKLQEQGPKLRRSKKVKLDRK